VWRRESTTNKSDKLRARRRRESAGPSSLFEPHLSRAFLYFAGKRDMLRDLTCQLPSLFYWD
jgi:hypothetical protein